ncbi:unnamed protein product [Rotaria socialis]|uniref:Uncharacterized protein n=1 Tax=Rotaria socialis TaxID=392032 RepID=A0A818H8G5_9BILA|nr:unnamed protein product [Rotaria socialis]CAF4935050.1 unnamed protein product [Rotaria socialis]
MPQLANEFEGFEAALDQERQETVQEIVQIAGQLELEANAEEVVELLESGNQPMSDKEIVGLDLHYQQYQEQEGEPDANVSVPKAMTVAELEKMMVKASKFFNYIESVDSNCDRSLTITTEMSNCPEP